MPKAPLFNMNGEKIGDYELPASVFGAPVNEHVLHEAVVMQLASMRLGTAKTKVRGEVAGWSEALASKELEGQGMAA